MLIMITQPEKFVFVVHEFGLYNGHGGIAAYTYYNVKQILETYTDINVYVLSPSKKGFEN